MVEEYLPTFHWIEGPKNIIADNLSRLHHLITPAQLTEGKILVEPAPVTDEENADEAFFLDQDHAGVFGEDILNSLDCYLNLPESGNPD